MIIYIAGNPTEAHIVCELLKQHEIEAEVRGEGIFSLKGELPLTDDSDPYVWLFDDTKSVAAKRIVSEFKADDEDTDEWQCLKCNEENEGQFALCWFCGASAPY